MQLVRRMVLRRLIISGTDIDELDSGSMLVPCSCVIAIPNPRVDRSPSLALLSIGNMMPVLWPRDLTRCVRSLTVVTEVIDDLVGDRMVE